jgi:hypothetical protein
MTSSLLGALGLVGLVFAVLHFLLGLFGAGFDPLWVGANLVAGIVLLVSAAALNLDALRERMASGEARRAGKYGTSALLGTGLLLVILGFLAFLSTRYHWRFDWSEAQVHSLSDQTQKLLAGLDAQLGRGEHGADHLALRLDGFAINQDLPIDRHRFEGADDVRL